MIYNDIKYRLGYRHHILFLIVMDYVDPARNTDVDRRCGSLLGHWLSYLSSDTHQYLGFGESLKRVFRQTSALVLTTTDDATAVDTWLVVSVSTVFVGLCT